MSAMSKIPDLSHKILNQVLHEIFYTKSNADAALWIGCAEIEWSYKNALYLKLDNLFNDELNSITVFHHL